MKQSKQPTKTKGIKKEKDKKMPMKRPLIREDLNVIQLSVPRG